MVIFFVFQGFKMLEDAERLTYVTTLGKGKIRKITYKGKLGQHNKKYMTVEEYLPKIALSKKKT